MNEKNNVSLVRCASYNPQEVQEAVKNAVELLGGIKKIVLPGARVLIKPNLLSDSPPEKGVDTHPEVLRAVIRLVKSVTGSIYCGDSPAVWGETKQIDRVYEISGTRKICEEEGIELVYFMQPKMRGGYPLTDWLDKVDCLISVPKFKTHGFTVLTAGLKNLYGLIVGMSKMIVHRDHPKSKDLSKAIVDLYQARRPDLTILDGIIAMEGEGPGASGTLKDMNLIAASQNAIALDVVLSKIMNLDPLSVPTNKEAVARGLINRDFSLIETSGEDVRVFLDVNFKIPKALSLNNFPDWLIDLLKKVLRIWPCADVNKCKLCGLCVTACPVSAIQIKSSKLSIDVKKCVTCLCCQEVCPEGAIELKKSLLWKLSTLRNRKKTKI